MQISAAITKSFSTINDRVVTWRGSLSLSSKIGLAFGLALATGLAAQLRLYLPGTPVPVTGQVLVVLMAGAILGGGFGALSQGLYLGLGFAGIPWFSGFSAGSAVLIGANGGYLLGFVPAALLVGLMTDYLATSPTRLRPLILSLLMMGGVAIIYLFGTVQLALFTGAGFHQTMAMGVAPFLLWDVVKALLAGSLACVLLRGPSGK